MQKNVNVPRLMYKNVDVNYHEVTITFPLDNLGVDVKKLG